MPTIDNLQIEIESNGTKAISAIDKLKNSLGQLNRAVGKMSGLETAADGILDIGIAAHEIKDDDVSRLERLAEALRSISTFKGAAGLRSLNSAVRSAGTAQARVRQATKPALSYDPNESLESIKSRITFSGYGYDTYTPKTGTIAVNPGINNRPAYQFTPIPENLKQEVNALTGEIKESTQELEKQPAVWERIKKSMSGISRPAFLDKVFNIGKMMVIRSVLRELIKGFTEGLENLYGWSKQTGGEYAKTMDRMKEVTGIFQNSIGAAAGALLQALAPAIITIINIATEFINVLNQVIALLSGQANWTKAVGALNDTDDATSNIADSAKAAHEQVKELLADFDELHIIQSESGAGGGSSSGSGSKKKQTDYSGLFQKTEFEGWAKWMQEHLYVLNGLAQAVGVAIAAWWIPGDFVKNFKIIAGIALILEGGIGLVKTIKAIAEAGGLTQELLGQLMQSVGKIIIGIGIITGNIPLLIGGIVATGIGYVLEHWEEIKKWWTDTALPALKQWGIDAKNSLSEGFNNFNEWVKEHFGVDLKQEFTNIKNDFVTSFDNAWNTICLGFNMFNTFVKDTFGVDIEAEFGLIGGTMQSLLSDPVGFVQTAWTNFTTWLSGKEFNFSVASLFSGLGAGIQKAMEDPIGFIQTAWSNLVTWFDENITKPIANFFIGCMNGMISALNWVIDAMNGFSFTIPGVELFGQKLWDDTTVGISGIPRLDMIPTLANGGILNDGQMFIAREAGPELVGTMGGHTAVANNDQIVAGVASGVAAGQAEQNSLLRQGIMLLQELTNKEFNAVVKPSAGLGRTIQQSSRMYSRMAGG